MDQFEYVMVLISIIVGLGIAHILLGIGGIIDRLSRKNDRLELSIAHAAWLGFCFMWLVMFWWWEYRFSTRVSEWTSGLYLFLVSYAVTLFVLQAILVPRNWDGVSSLQDYFLERRVWFYSLLAVATLLDQFDSFLKGGVDYLWATGYFNIAFALTTIPVVIIGIRTANARVHNTMGLVFFVCQFLLAFDFLSVLAT